MSRFAHISDIHLGSQRDPYMREWEMKSFRMAMDICVKKEVNFIVISGDLFHNSVPSLSVLNEVLSVLTGVRDAGIPVYVVYGSHDYSHDSIGAVDILETAGVITNVAAGGEKIFTVDPGTGAKITGISGRKVGLEKDEFASLNRDALENEEGFRIFVFHSAISEFKPPDLSEMESIEISYFPKGFDYYAGGHIHRRGEFDFPGYDRIVFPGPLYLGWQSEDISRIFRGEERGFYIVDFDGEVKDAVFVGLPPFPGLEISVNLTGINAEESNLLIRDRMRDPRISGKALLLRVYGKISGGRTSDIDFREIRKLAITNGVAFLQLDRFSLESEEMVRYKVSGGTVQEIEKNVIMENAGNFQTSLPPLQGEKGVEMAVSLLQLLRSPRMENETESNYATRIMRDSLKTLGIELEP